MPQKISLGRTLIVANPTSQSGAGAAAAERLQRFLSLYLPHDSFELARTEAPRHGVELARGAAGFDTVCALGGDGTVHEVANGLMRIEAAERPALAVVPVGSGNDYARTLGMGDWTGQDFSPLLSYEKQPMDVGCIEYGASDEADGCPGGGASTEHFVQTLSIGLDAAIALGTHELRKSTHLSGTALYMASGVEVFGRGYRSFPARVKLDGQAAVERDLLVFAVQIGRTYGSGFPICPEADPQDGLFDICYAEGPYPRLGALGIFLAAKSGRHAGFKRINFARAESLELELAGDGYPVQADGEKIEARRLSVSILPRALQVWQPPATRPSR